MIVIYKRIEKRMGQGDKDPQTLATTGLVYVPNKGTTRGQQGDKSLF